MKTLITILLLASSILPAYKKQNSNIITLTNTRLLTQHVWKADKSIMQLGNSDPSTYIRNEINTTPYPTENWQTQSFTYREDGTGTLVDGDAVNYNFSWAFAEGDETTINMTIYYPSPLSFVLSFVALSPDSFIYTQTYTNSGTFVMSQNIYIPAESSSWLSKR